VEGKCGPVAAWSPDDRLLAVAGPAGTICLWDAAAGRWLAPLTGHEQEVLGLAWSSDGKRLASGSADGTARVWDVAAGEPRRKLGPREGCVFTVAWSPDFRTLGLGTFGAVQLWEVGADRPPQALRGHTGPVRAVSWSPDGRRLAAAAGLGDGSVILRKAPGGELAHRLPADRDGVFAVAWSADGKVLASAGADGRVRLWDAGTGRPLGDLEGHAGPARALAWSAETGILASAGEEGTVRLWKGDPPRPGALLVPLRGGQGVALSPDGHWTGLPQVEGQLVYVVQTDSGQQTLTPGEFGSTYGWENDPSLVASAGK
jgi:WD40 repeat protein